MIAVDPGSMWWGVATIDPVGRSLLAGVVLDVGEMGEGCLLGGLVRRVGAGPMAIERPAGIRPGVARLRPAAASTLSAELVTTAWLGGELVGLLRARGVRVVEVPAETWRVHYFGVANPDEQAIAALVESRLPDAARPWPGEGAAYGRRGLLLSSERSHLYDAAAVALYACEVAS